MQYVYWTVINHAFSYKQQMWRWLCNMIGLRLVVLFTALHSPFGWSWKHAYIKAVLYSQLDYTPLSPIIGQCPYLHSYLVGNLTISLIAETKALENRTSKILTLLYEQFSNLLIFERDMSGPRLGPLSNNRWPGVHSVSHIKLSEVFGEIVMLNNYHYCITVFNN
jgi:hypothetical protein